LFHTLCFSSMFFQKFKSYQNFDQKLCWANLSAKLDNVWEVMECFRGAWYMCRLFVVFTSLLEYYNYQFLWIFLIMIWFTNLNFIKHFELKLYLKSLLRTFFLLRILVKEINVNRNNNSFHSFCLFCIIIYIPRNWNH
jgi:hypothetical protein